jgi:ribosome-binding protein aMBF1 (putative translation factor)
VATLDLALAQLVDHLEAELGLSRNELAQVLEVSPRSIERWRGGETHPQHEARQRLAHLENLVGHLRQTFAAAEAGRAWLRDANRFLGGLTPAEALRAGRVDRVVAALEAVDSGIFV